MKRLLTVLLLFLLCQSALAQSTYRPVIKGLDGTLLEAVQTRLDVSTEAVGQPLTMQKIHTLYKINTDDIHEVLRANAYFKPTITSQLTQDDGVWMARYTVDKGAKLRITALSLTIKGPARDDPRFLDLRQNFPLKVGDPLISENYEQAKQSLFTLANQRGYLAAKLDEHAIEISLENYTARVQLVFTSGPRYRFGRITIDSGPFSQSFIRRFIHFREGEYYSSDALIRLQQDLEGSENFANVEIQSRPQLAKGLSVPIQIHLVPRKARQYLLGVGYGTDTGPRATLGMNWRRVRAVGHHLRFLLKGSLVQNTFLASYLIPGRNPVTDQYNVTAGLQHENTRAGRSLVRSLSVGYSKTLPYWQRVISLSFQDELSKISGEPRRHTQYLLPRITWTHIKAENRIYTRKGRKIGITIQGAPQFSGNNTSFVQAILDAKWINPVGKKGRVIIRGKVGATAVKNINLLPYSLRLYAGGANSIRGYDYQHLGPGKFLQVASVEYQHRLFGQWFVGVFADAGNASDSFLQDIKTSAGFGIGYISPIGPLEITIARGFDRNDHALNLQFEMGPDL